MQHGSNKLRQDIKFDDIRLPTESGTALQFLSMLPSLLHPSPDLLRHLAEPFYLCGIGSLFLIKTQRNHPSLKTAQHGTVYTVCYSCRGTAASLGTPE